MSLEPSLKGDEKAHLRKNLRCKSEKRRKRKMVKVGDPKGCINVDIEADQNGEFRQLIATIKHSIEIDINGTTVVLYDSDVHRINYMPTDINEVRKIIFEKLENTLRTVCDRAERMQGIINMLENVALGTGCEFNISVSKNDC
jgi:hypothetical protein